MLVYLGVQALGVSGGRVGFLVFKFSGWHAAFGHSGASFLRLARWP